MDAINTDQRKDKLKKLSHILAGMIIFLHAYEKYHSHHGSYIFFIIAGIIFISIALFHHSLKQKFPWVDNCFFVIEALLSLIIAYEYFHAGKKGLPVMYLIAASFQLGAVYFFSKRMKR